MHIIVFAFDAPLKKHFAGHVNAQIALELTPQVWSQITSSFTIATVQFEGQSESIPRDTYSMYVDELLPLIPKDDTAKNRAARAYLKQYPKGWACLVCKGSEQ